VRAAFERSGLNVEHLDEQRRQSPARLEVALGRFRAGSDEDAPAMAQAVARSAQNWLEAQRLRSTLAAAGIYSLTTADADAKHQADLRCEIGWVASDGAGNFDAAANGRKLSGFGVVIDTQPRASSPRPLTFSPTRDRAT
jgi:hypothetical protein